MQIVLIVVGKTDQGELDTLISCYTSRLRHYIPFELQVIPDVKLAKSRGVEVQKQQEGEEILKRLHPGDHVVLLDERGKALSSREWASSLEQHMLNSTKRIVYIIGGPYGFSADLYRRADMQLSLSRLTFSHQMVRLFVVEQLYRAFTILRGEPYHHD
ncbi:50S rRNA methyltransferase [Porphyromonas crevioricanis]|uniref:Ribosomal RNA large subunit methyltransferase H n=1 Tax=Porphyromonas crevioricanis TaxID=393921 RepID=A0A0A2FDU8_9PORP|nr:23S rRNA (pseudouridine(1915)-N(3))-methyltransferase RlmH [Porphyromonas crevioricanis]KGN89211.1 50S rRNA methyltransferase [Porphyromonas crevioricanis]KGN96948.1 50S rRNA methyltransferase [Porphyromonas crevioricanis]SJZ99359.1 23S rRNA (pseudouridine1915-N3)-methyltransferase [Porphyromonas crevioricanis]SQH72474.1 Ribosomal RNA large subunit methyltransferase H [Porphyromonas crevioricanis]